MTELKNKCDKLERQIVQLQNIIAHLTNNMKFCNGCEKLIFNDSDKCPHCIFSSTALRCVSCGLIDSGFTCTRCQLHYCWTHSTRCSCVCGCNYVDECHCESDLVCSYCIHPASDITNPKCHNCITLPTKPVVIPDDCPNFPNSTTSYLLIVLFVFRHMACPPVKYIKFKIMNLVFSNQNFYMMEWPKCTYRFLNGAHCGYPIYNKNNQYCQGCSSRGSEL